MAQSVDINKALSSGGLSLDQPFYGPVQVKGKVLGASTTSAPTVKRYTTPATQTRTSLPGPVAPTIPTPTPQSPVSQPVPQTGEPSNYTNPVDQYYNNLDTTAPTADEQVNVRDQARKDFQAYIDAINNEYAGLISTTSQQYDQYGQQTAGMTRAAAARSGTLGSDFGNAAIANDAATTGKNKDAAIKALQNEQTSRIQEINGKIDQRARDEIAASKAEALGNAEKYVARLSQNQETAKQDLKTVAKSGVALDKTKMQVLQKQSGYDPLTFESIYNANKPVPEFTAPMQLKDGSLIITDKTTGEVKNLGKYDLPNNFDFVFAPDGTPMVFDKDTGLTQIAANFHKGQFAKPVTHAEKIPASANEMEYANELRKKNGLPQFTDLVEYKNAIKDSGSTSNPFQ